MEQHPDLVIIGNTKALARGNPVTEFVLNEKIPFTSGSEWIYSNILKERWVIAVSGTHGKTTTTAMIVWIMERAGLKPGYLIGNREGKITRLRRPNDISHELYDAEFYAEYKYCLL